MNEIDQLIIKNVRCFKGTHRLDIRPLTFILGENSTGKSTALGCLNAIQTSINGFTLLGQGIDFNQYPYDMGVFSDIVSKPKDSTNSFQVGLKYKSFQGTFDALVTLREQTKGSEPSIKEIVYKFNDGKITISLSKNIRAKSQSTDFFIFEPNEIKKTKDKHEFKLKFIFSDIPYLNLGFCHSVLSTHLRNSREIRQKYTEEQREDFDDLINYLATKDIEGLRHYRYHNNVMSLPPIRSEPKRTYNPGKTSSRSVGDNTALILRNLEEPAKSKLLKELNKFGKDSELFEAIDIRELTDSKSDPFQLSVKVRGKKVNMIDTGYGVSQILPILVRVFSMPPSMHLIQQPEVHLHPKAQAELTSSFIGLMKDDENQELSFIMETHSDYMINRARIEIMKGKIKPEDVSLIYLASDEKTGVKVHNIKFDDIGNLLNVPRNYRKFFINEGDKLRGF